MNKRLDDSQRCLSFEFSHFLISFSIRTFMHATRASHTANTSSTRHFAAHPFDLFGDGCSEPETICQYLFTSFADMETECFVDFNRSNVKEREKKIPKKNTICLIVVVITDLVRRRLN